MIIGTGIDITDSRRVKKIMTEHGDRFTTRYFTAIENEAAQNKSDLLMHYTKRFAAKEACAKALKTGFRNGIRMQDMEITNDENGCPALKLSGKALEQMRNLLPDNKNAHIHLSLSDEPPYAIAHVIIEAV